MLSFNRPRPHRMMGISTVSRKHTARWSMNAAATASMPNSMESSYCVAYIFWLWVIVGTVTGADTLAFRVSGICFREGLNPLVFHYLVLDVLWFPVCFLHLTYFCMVGGYVVGASFVRLSSGSLVRSISRYVGPCCNGRISLFFSHSLLLGHAWYMCPASPHL